MQAGSPVPLRFGLEGPIEYGLTHGGSPTSVNGRRPGMEFGGTQYYFPLSLRGRPSERCQVLFCLGSGCRALCRKKVPDTFSPAPVETCPQPPLS